MKPYEAERRFYESAWISQSDRIRRGFDGSSKAVCVVIRDLVKNYGLFLALDGFTCNIPKGITGLLGPNGAGKTTFIRAVLGIHPFKSGEINFLDYKLPEDL